MSWRSIKTGGTLSGVLDAKIDAVLPSFARGKTIEVSFKSSDGSPKNYSIPLKGSAQARFAYEKCLATVKWTAGAAAPN